MGMGAGACYGWVISYDDLKKIKDIKLIINTTSVGFDSWFFRNKF